MPSLHEVYSGNFTSCLEFKFHLLGALNRNPFSIIEFGLKCGCQEGISKTKNPMEIFHGGQTNEQPHWGLLEVLNLTDITVVQETYILFPGQAKSSALLPL